MMFRTRKAVRRLKAKAEAAEQQQAQPTTNQRADTSIKMSWVHACVNAAVENAEARLRQQLQDQHENIVINSGGVSLSQLQQSSSAVAKALAATIHEERQRSDSGQAALTSNVEKLGQQTGLAVNELEEKLHALESQFKELRLTLNSRPPAPRKLTVTHADGSVSTMVESLADAGEAQADDDMLRPPDRP